MLRHTASRATEQEIEVLVTGCAYFYSNADPEPTDGYQTIEQQDLGPYHDRVIEWLQHSLAAGTEMLRLEGDRLSAYNERVWQRFMKMSSVS
jgi:hypothetical protein